MERAVYHTVGGWLAMGNEHSLGFPPLQAQDRQLVAGPMSHASGFLVWPMIAAGACHVIMPRFNAAGFLDLVESHRCTRALLVPTMIRMIVDRPDAGRRNLSSLVAIYYGAAPNKCLPITVLSPAYHRPEGTDRERAWLRSAGRAASSSGMVVRFFSPLTTPFRPSRRISRSTVHRATSMPSRCSWRHSLRAPYTPNLALPHPPNLCAQLPISPGPGRAPVRVAFPPLVLAKR